MSLLPIGWTVNRKVPCEATFLVTKSDGAHRKLVRSVVKGNPHVSLHRTKVSGRVPRN